MSNNKSDYDYSQYYYGRYKKMFRSGYFQSYKPDNSDFTMTKEFSGNEREQNTEPHTVVDMRRNVRDDYKPKKKRGKNIAITICAIIMCMSILLLSVDFFSAKGIVEELRGVFSFSKETCTNYYAINMGSFNTLTEARNMSDAIRNQGAAGYITNNGTYNVLAACYLNYEDAKAIADANSATIFTIRVFQKNKKNLPVKLRDSYQLTVGYEKTVYDSLYSLSNRLDENEINEDDCRQTIIELKGRIQSKTKDFMDLSADYTDEYTLEIRVSIIACLSAIDNLTNSSLIRPNLLCDIRYTYLMILNLA